MTATEVEVGQDEVLLFPFRLDLFDRNERTISNGMEKEQAKLVAGGRREDRKEGKQKWSGAATFALFLEVRKG